MGAPAGGMNAATRAFVRLMITEGYEVFAFEFGFDGLVNDQVSTVSKASNPFLNVNTKTQLHVRRLLFFQVERTQNKLNTKNITPFQLQNNMVVIINHKIYVD